MYRTKSKLKTNKMYFCLSYGPISLSYFRLGYFRISPSKFFYIKDFSMWTRFELFDSGWGNRDGLMKLIDYSFNDLIELYLSCWKPTTLKISAIDNNRYGSSLLMIDRYFDKVIDYFESAINSNDFLAEDSNIEAMKFIFTNEYVANNIKSSKTVEEKQIWKKTVHAILSYINRVESDK